jgi:hypothetical protein
MRAQDRTHAFILRVRLLGHSDGYPRARFSVEDVCAGRKQQFATFELAVAQLGARIHEIVSGQIDDRGQP